MFRGIHKTISLVTTFKNVAPNASVLSFKDDIYIFCVLTYTKIQFYDLLLLLPRHVSILCLQAVPATVAASFPLLLDPWHPGHSVISDTTLWAPKRSIGKQHQAATSTPCKPCTGSLLFCRIPTPFFSCVKKRSGGAQWPSGLCWAPSPGAFLAKTKGKTLGPWAGIPGAIWA